MKKNQLSLLIVFVGLTLALAGCGRQASNNQPATTNNDVTGNQEESYFSEKVADMFKKGQPLECRTEIETTEGATTAVYYFDNVGQRVRVDMKMVAKENGVTINTTSITKEGWNYFWDDLMNKDGMKVKLDQEAEAGANTKSPVDSEEKFEFRCRPWQVENNKFELPADKNFKDLSNLGQIGGTVPAAATVPANVQATGETPNICSFCDMLPEGPERAECLSSC